MITLKFPLSNDGPAQGINDAGIETFEGAVGYYVARECSQNARDAGMSVDQKVTLAFDLEYWPVAEVPCFCDIIKTLDLCRQYWTGNGQIVTFCDQALKEYSKLEQMPVLRIRDSGTTGLTGDDKDRAGKWYGLVRSVSVSNKEGGEGGSFGIGKGAPFSASGVRTVLYYTHTKDGDAFQGVCRLVSHVTDSNPDPTQGIGFIGLCEDGRFKALRNPNDIADRFLRIGEDYGTDVYVVAYRDIADGWDRRLISAVLRDFWPAIHEGLFEVRIVGRLLSKSTLLEDLMEFANDPEFSEDFDAHLYYKALMDGKCVEENIPGLDWSVKLCLLAGDAKWHKRVARVRANGMVIDRKPYRSLTAYCGFFSCKYPEGNIELRKLEPPRHDKWDPGRHPDGVKKGKFIIRCIDEWIKKHIAELTPKVDAQEVNVAESAQYLPDYDDKTEGLSGATADEAPLGGAVEHTLLDSTDNPAMTVLQNRDLESGDKGVTGGTGKYEGTPVAGPGENTNVQGGKHREIGGGGSKTPRKRRQKTKANVVFRLIPDGRQKGLLLLRSHGSAWTGRVEIYSEGDSGTGDCLQLTTVCDETGKQYTISNGKTIMDVSVAADTPLKLFLSHDGDLEDMAYGVTLI